MRFTFVSLLGLAAAAMVGCSNGEAVGPNSSTQTVGLRQDAQTALQKMLDKDPNLQNVINDSYAYAVFPDVGKAALIVGGAGGRGVVYRNGQVIGTAKLEQVSAGPQIEGGSYSELVVFKDANAFQRFENGNLQWGAQASAIAVKAGAGAATDFDNGVAAYVLPRGGLGAGASIGGQKLTYMPESGS